MPNTIYSLPNNLIIETAVVFDPNIVPVLEETLLFVQERLRLFGGDPEFQQKMMLAFSKNIEINSLQTAWLTGDFSILSGLEIRQGTELNGANGAYGLSTDRIYLSEAFIRNNQDNLDALVSLVLEEAGHRIDAQLNQVDTVGDESQYFSTLVLGKELTSEQLVEIKAEDDHAMITLSTQNTEGIFGVENVAVEMATAMVTIKGKIEWKDSAGNLHPVRNGWIELWEEDPPPFSDDLITGGATNNKGDYTFTKPLDRFLDLEFPLAQEGEVYLYLRSEPFNYPYQVWTGNNLFDEVYKYYSPIKIISTAGTYDVSKIFDSTTDMGKAFSVYDAIFVGQQYGLAVFQETEQPPLIAPPLLTIKYPDDSGADQDGGEGAYYLNNEIHLTEGNWEDWDVILHEFGHYLADQDSLIPSDAPGGDHQFGQSNIESRGKYDGIRLAWSEGLASYLSLAIQRVAHDQQLLPQGIPNVNVSNLTYFETYNLDFENNSTLGEGEGDEFPVARILWDLADGKNETNDEIEVVFNSGVVSTVGHIALYKILDQKIPEGSLDRLEDVWEFFYNNPNYLGLSGGLHDNAKREKLGKIFDANGISPHINNFKQDNLGLTSELQLLGTWNPSITWKLGNNNANDTFQIIIFNRDFSQKVIEKSLDSTALSHGEWTIDNTTNLGEWKPELNTKYGKWTWRELYQNPDDYHLVITGSDAIVDYGFWTGWAHSSGNVTGPYWSGAYAFKVVNINGTPRNDLLNGTADNNSILGGGGNDTLIGGLGADTLQGGLGNDLYYVDNTGDRIVELANEGIDTVNSSITYTLGANVENLTLTGTGNINSTGNTLNNRMTGNSGNNRLNGGAGNDTLNGGLGADTLQGGLGNDLYYVENTGDHIGEALNEGTDTVITTITYNLGSNTENLTLTGTTAINGTGNTLNNIITGNSGANTLNGSTGGDTLIGGTGNDIYLVDNIADKVTETSTIATEIDTVQSTVTYILTSNVENLTLTGTTAINGTGNTFNNVITGNSGNNRLDGGDGNDTLIGGSGNDTLSGGNGNDSMIGGVGNDLYGVNTTGDLVVEALNGGTDSVNSSITYTLTSNVENLTLTGTTAINGTGNSLNNIIIGNSANNRLDGGDGNDTLISGRGNDTLSGGNGNDSMVGGVGNDLYGVNTTNDRIVEALNAGIDTVNSAITYTLGANLENLTLTGTTAIDGTGNTLNNVITDNSGNNILTGEAGNDTLIGGAGNDTLIGGIGNDTLTGGTGNDFFRFNSTSEKIDRITDFNITDDTIQIVKSSFNSNLALGILSSSQFTIGASATTSAQRFFYNSSNGGLFFDSDGNGATSALQFATLNTGLALTNQDIVVI
jgi:Ca2+-binding RTX toxin-like protein